MIILSLGGSLINPGKIDTAYLKEFRKFVLASKEKFIIVCGGGALAREYMSAARTLCPSITDVDWYGIEATWLNANLVWRLFHLPPREVFRVPVKSGFQKVLIASGWKPGFSTDYCAVMWAIKNNAKVIYNLTNTDYVYDKDPKKFKSAPLKTLAWNDYLKLIGTWKSGLHSPFDPVASAKAKKHGIKVIILNGKKLNNLHRALTGKSFVGTVIE
ncbi:UMP kinase [Candidatus Woesearchaeota archaeon]|nr:UMP kinase [Candidatus Woesearchaeota archaeon]